MDFLELAKARYSCRSFLENKPVEQEKIDALLEVARLAPTAANLQPHKIFVLTEKEQLEKLSACTRFGWNAPLILITCYDKNVSWKRKFDGHDEGHTDASIVTTHMMLEASALGLGSTWIAFFDPNKVHEVYQIPENYEVSSILAVGYPSEEAKPSQMHFQRKEINEIAVFNKFA